MDDIDDGLEQFATDPKSCCAVIALIGNVSDAGDNVKSLTSFPLRCAYPTRRVNEFSESCTEDAEGWGYSSSMGEQDEGRREGGGSVV